MALQTGESPLDICIMIFCHLSLIWCPSAASAESGAVLLSRRQPFLPDGAGEAGRTRRLPACGHVHFSGTDTAALSGASASVYVICSMSVFLQARADQNELRHLTSGNWEVTQILAYDENSQSM